jgi:ABC-2 type transport system permease protein
MTTTSGTPAGTWAPSPGAAGGLAMLRAQTILELRLGARNGEQLLLTLIIPVVLLVGLGTVRVLDLGAGARIDVVTPGILALAVMSTAFTGQAIATGFERRYGALKLLGTTPLSRGRLLLAKTLAVLVVEAVQVVLLGSVALLLGWSPHGSPAAALLLLLAGTLAFSALGLLLAGVLRAEATLAVANGVYVLLLLGGGVVIPLAVLPEWLARLDALLPSGALAEGLREVLLAGEPLPWSRLAVLLVWAVAAGLAASATFRWE